VARTSARRQTVCICAFHPLALSEFERLLSGENVRLLTRRLEPDGVSSSRGPGLPRAPIYVVELHPHRHAAGTLVSRVFERSPAARVIVVAEKFDDATAFALLRLGVKGLVRYSEATEGLPQAVRSVLKSGYWVPRAVLSRFIEQALGGAARVSRFRGRFDLSRREKEVMALLLENLSNKEIAGRLHMSERTVKFHVSNLLGKHGVKRRSDLILLSFAERKHAS